MQPAARPNGSTARRAVGLAAATLRSGNESARGPRGAETNERVGEARARAVGPRDGFRQAIGRRVESRSRDAPRRESAQRQRRRDAHRSSCPRVGKRNQDPQATEQQSVFLIFKSLKRVALSKRPFVIYFFKGLREANDELQAQLFSRGLEEGRTLLNEHLASNSLAAEFEVMSQDDVSICLLDSTKCLLGLIIDILSQIRTALREQQEVNAQLRSYIEGILLTIVENQPSLLERKPLQ